MRDLEQTEKQVKTEQHESRARCGVQHGTAIAQRDSEVHSAAGFQVI
jgi:hypothetical protein